MPPRTYCLKLTAVTALQTNGRTDRRIGGDPSCGKPCTMRSPRWRSCRQHCAKPEERADEQHAAADWLDITFQRVVQPDLHQPGAVTTELGKVLLFVAHLQRARSTRLRVGRAAKVTLKVARLSFLLTSGLTPVQLATLHLALWPNAEESLGLGARAINETLARLILSEGYSIDDLAL